MRISGSVAGLYYIILYICYAAKATTTRAVVAFVLLTIYNIVAGYFMVREWRAMHAVLRRHAAAHAPEPAGATIDLNQLTGAPTAPP